MANPTIEIRSNDPPSAASAAGVDMKFELVVIPVLDVDRAKEFYASLGWRLDADFPGDDFLVVQFTPPGSGGLDHLRQERNGGQRPAPPRACT
jgi:catechol 2,3-dioxygenase-like lactoylglutathione lyase family enzyme